MRIFLASLADRLGIPSFQKTLKTDKPLYLLETFYSGANKCKQVVNLVGENNFLLDSGAYSFMSGAKCTLETMNDYVSQYAKFIKENNIKYYMEIDVDNIFGLGQVEEWRHYLEKETNVPCIPVWHKGRGVDYYVKMCKEYEYVAIGGLVFHVNKAEWPAIKKMSLYGHYHGNKVHGLGFTKTRILDEFKWYSVDSCSWKLSAIRGSTLQQFDGEKIVQRSIDRGQNKVDHNKLIEYNYKEWVKYQKYMNRKAW